MTLWTGQIAGSASGNNGAASATYPVAPGTTTELHEIFNATVSNVIGASGAMYAWSGSGGGGAGGGSASCAFANTNVNSFSFRVLYNA